MDVGVGADLTLRTAVDAPMGDFASPTPPAGYFSTEDGGANFNQGFRIADLLLGYQSAWAEPEDQKQHQTQRYQSQMGG